MMSATVFAYLVHLVHIVLLMEVAHLLRFWFCCQGFLVVHTLPEHSRECCPRYDLLSNIYAQKVLMLTGSTVQVGLLSKDNMEQIPFAYKLYKSTRPSKMALVSGFKETLCRPVPIDFLGVW